MTKAELRLKYKNLRKSLSEEEIASKSIAIANQILQLPIWEKTYFHVFLPIATQNEVDTELILPLLLSNDKEIVVSKSDFDTRKMTHFLLTENTQIKKNEYGIPEPVDGIEVPVHKIQVVFVPLLAYDFDGNRVGYGKGFYDQFLSECLPNTLKIGLSFFEPEPSIEDCNENDVRLNYVVTPKNSIQF